MQQDAGFLPDYDPDGRKLVDVVAAAANRYSHILRDSWVINIEVRYAQPGTMSSLAFAAPTATLEFDPVGHPNAIRAVGGRVTFNPGVQWFLDPTPFDDEEFDLTTTRFGQLAPSDQSQSFVGEIPFGMEVAYFGHSPVAVGIDALSVAMHELGHLLGVSGGIDEAIDGVYSIDPQFVYGASVGVLARVGDSGHLNHPRTIMGASFGGGVRRLPTATDVFAMAAGSGWSDVDLPRKEFWGGSEWHDPFNWAGHRLPDDGDDAYVRNSNTVYLTGDAQVGRLFLDEAAMLATAGHALDLGQMQLGENVRLAIMGSRVIGDRLFVEQTATIDFTIAGSATPGMVFFDSAELAGTLDLSLDNGYMPTVGDRTTVVASKAITGKFDRLLRSDSAELVGLDVVLDHQVLSIPVFGDLQTLDARFVIEGDANADGHVDQADLDAILLHWGDQVPAAWIESGDLSGNGMVEQADLDRVLLNWGRSVNELTTTNSIPEPASAALAIVLVLLWMADAKCHLHIASKRKKLPQFLL